MGSRVRENAKLLFEVYCEVRANNGEELAIINKYPQSFSDSELSKVPKFAFPCEMDETIIQCYSFVLTSMDSKYTFGYCRFDPESKTAMVVLSPMPWHEIFYRFLNCIAPLSRKADRSEMYAFLTACYVRPPMVGHTLRITYNDGADVFQCEHPNQVLPSIPENYNITLFFSTLEWKCMAGLFAALLHERRIVVVATKPSRLSAIVQAGNMLLYPMSWQHIFIPILPKQLTDYLLAPMPFLVGVPRSVMNNVRLTDIGEIVLIDADRNELKSPFNDLESLPADVISALRKALNDKNALGDSVSRAFLRALVHLIGGYRNAIRIEKRQLITFNAIEFVKTRKNMEPFLTKILHSQIFQQFIEERLELLNSGRGFSDVFEMECYEYAEKTSGGSGHRMKQQYKDWAKAMKREGGAILKTVRDKANPAMKSAVNSFRQGGRSVKSAVKGLKMKIPKSASRSSTADESRSASSSSSESVGSQASTQSAPVSPQKMGLSLLEEMNLVIPLHCDSAVAPADLVNSTGSLGSKPQDNSKDGASSKVNTLKTSGSIWHTFEEVNRHTGRTVKSNTGSIQNEMSHISKSQAQDLMDFSKQISRGSTLPPRLPRRPAIPSRYPIVPTQNLIDLSDAPRPPPRAGNFSRPQFSREITKSENSGQGLREAGPIHFTEVYPDGKRAAERRMSLWKTDLGAPARSSNSLKATLSAPPSITSRPAQTTPQSLIHNISQGEDTPAQSDLLKMNSTDFRLCNLLDAFDPLKSDSANALHTSPASRGGSDPTRKKCSRNDFTFSTSTANSNPFSDGFSSMPQEDFDPFRLQQGDSQSGVSYLCASLTDSNARKSHSDTSYGGSPYTISPIPAQCTDESICTNDQALLWEYGIDFNRFDLNTAFLESDHENESINKSRSSKNDDEVRGLSADHINTAV